MSDKLLLVLGLAQNRRSPKRPSEPRPSGVHPEEVQWKKGAKPPRVRLEGELSECLERNGGLERDFMCCIVALRLGEFMVVRAMHPQYPIQEETWNLLDRALNEYGLILDEEEYEKAVRSRYPEL